MRRNTPLSYSGDLNKNIGCFELAARWAFSGCLVTVMAAGVVIGGASLAFSGCRETNRAIAKIIDSEAPNGG
jgi:hypothetical protein